MILFKIVKQQSSKTVKQMAIYNDFCSKSESAWAWRSNVLVFVYKTSARAPSAISVFSLLDASTPGTQETLLFVLGHIFSWFSHYKPILFSGKRVSFDMLFESHSSPVYLRWFHNGLFWGKTWFWDRFGFDPALWREIEDYPYKTQAFYPVVLI